MKKPTKKTLKPRKGGSTIVEPKQTENKKSATKEKDEANVN